MLEMVFIAHSLSGNAASTVPAAAMQALRSVLLDAQGVREVAGVMLAVTARGLLWFSPWSSWRRLRAPFLFCLA
jgi:hypothetical protein